MFDRVFRGLYLAGVVGAVGLVFTQPFAGYWLIDLGESFPGSMWLFSVGVGHMVLLTGAVPFVSPAQRAAAGRRIQTGGYLHTLNGFAAAILFLWASTGGGLADFTTLLGPLGMALGTSIIGWFVGGEVIAEAPGTVSRLEEAVRESARDLRAFSSDLSRFRKSQREALDEVDRLLGDLRSDVFERLRNQFEEIGAQAAGLLTAIKSTRESMDALNNEDFGATLEAARESFGETSSVVQKLAERIGVLEAKVHKGSEAFDQASGVMGEFAGAALEAHQGHLEALEAASTILGQTRERYTDLLKNTEDALEPINELATSLRTQITELSSVVNSMNEKTTAVSQALDDSLGEQFEEGLTGLVSDANRVSEAMAEAASKAEDFAVFVRQSRILYEEVERLITSAVDEAE